MHDVQRDRDRQARCRCSCRRGWERCCLIVVVPAVLDLRRHADAGPCCAPRSAAAGPSEAAPAATASRTSAAAAPGDVRREVVGHAQVHVVACRARRRNVMKVAARVCQVGRRYIGEQCERRRAHQTGGNPVAGERLAGCRVDDGDSRRREVTVTHRFGRDGGVLVEQVRAVIARVGHHEVGAPRAVVHVPDFHRAPNGAAECVPRVRTLCHG